MSSVDQQILVEYLEGGGSLYIEGAEVAYSLLGTELFSYLNVNYLGNGAAPAVEELYGEEGTFLQNMYFSFPYNSYSDYMLDELDTDTGINLMTSQDGISRVIAYSNENYRVITSSFVFGSLIDTESSTKTDLMIRYLNYLADITVETDNSAIPVPAGLYLKNYPNPFSSSGTARSAVTKFSFEIKNGQWTELVVFNLKGQLVKTLYSGNLNAGKHEIAWDGKDDNNQNISSGVYFYRLKSGVHSETKKMLLLK
ncbi:MAG: FlgD immunoglobulin-like domain containing protein [Candidatus Cloacimonetes bacterium]|nr:FlgD immunoglobulin-like domain containing protein [Candidatus Cloacimonadota bacterium]